MSTSDNIVSSQTKQSFWCRPDTARTLGLFDTTINTGVLSFPVRVGFGGPVPIFLMLVLAYPVTSYCHRVLARLCLSGFSPSGNITETVEERLGKTGGVVTTFLYFFAICPLLWVYGVIIINTFMTFWENQLRFAPLNHDFVALFLLLLMAFVIWFGKDLVTRVMSYLVQSFIASLVLISLSLIPYWNSAVIDQVDLGSLSLIGHNDILITIWLGVPIMVLSLNFSLIVSSFVVSRREECEKDFGHDFTERKCFQIISYTSTLMVVVMMFLAFSCLFTLSPANIAEAKAQNIPMLSYLANHFVFMTDTKTMLAITPEYAAFIIALVAIFKSSFGHYLGTLGDLNDLILKFGYRGDKARVSLGKLNTINMIFIMDSTWVITYASPNIPGLTEAMGTPIIAPLLCLLPMCAIRKAPFLARYRGRLDNVFITVIGLLTVLNIVYKLF